MSLLALTGFRSTAASPHSRNRRPGSAPSPADGADWHDSALVYAVTWMLLGLPISYVLAALTAMLWSWLSLTVGWFAVAAMTIPVGLLLVLGFLLYVRLPLTAMIIHRQRGGPLARLFRFTDGVRGPATYPGRTRGVS